MSTANRCPALAMSNWKPGQDVDVLGPLGKGFPLPKDSSKVILVAGGIGIASFYLLAKRLPGALMLFGSRSEKEARLAREFKKLGLRVKLATEDGSVGAKGYVTELLKKEIKRDSVIYGCGPMVMLKEVARITSGTRCYVSLETAMACGIGVCLGCAVKVVGEKGKLVSGYENYKMVCSDGPVFPADQIDWDKI